MAIDPLTAGFDLAKTIANKLWPDKSEQEKAELTAQIQAATQEFQLASGQLEVNKVEAASTIWFVAGWRPYIGWICGTGLGYQFLFMPIMNGFIKAIFDIAPFASLDTASLAAIVTGMLGLGGLRTFEKYSGTESKR